MDNGTLHAVNAVSAAGTLTSAVASFFGVDIIIAMGATAGCFFFLATTAKLPISFRMLSGIGALLFGFLAGLALLPLLESPPLCALIACAASSLISWVVGSLSQWAAGGPRPDWIRVALLLLQWFAPSGLAKPRRKDE